MSRSLISAGGSTPRASHSKQPTLRQGLSISLAAIFAVSSIVVVIAVVFLIPRLSSIPLTLFYLALLLLVNVSIVLSLGRYLIRRRLLSDLDELVEGAEAIAAGDYGRSEEHTSELQSRGHLVCRLLLEKKKRVR